MEIVKELQAEGNGWGESSTDWEIYFNFLGLLSGALLDLKFATNTFLCLSGLGNMIKTEIQISITEII